MGAVLTLYFAYFVYAMGLIAASQLAGSPSDGWGLSVAWGVETKDVISALSVMAIGKFISYPFAGFLADRFGRRKIVLVGIALNVIFFLLLPISPNRTIGMLLAAVFGIGNSFLDAGTYPTLMESNPSNAGTMNILIKIFISAGQFVMPLLITMVGTQNWRIVPIAGGIYMVVMGVLACIVSFPDYKKIAAEQLAAQNAAEQAAGTKNGSTRARARFAVEGSACLIFIFCTNGIVYLANQALPQIGANTAHLTEAQGRTLTQFFTIGSVVAVLLTAMISSRGVKSINFVPVYAACGLVSVVLLNIGFMHSLAGMRITAFLIGYFVSGGIMQLVLTAMSDFFPKSKGQIVSWYWMAGAVGGFVLPYAVGAIVPSTAGVSDEEAVHLLTTGYTNVVWLAVAFSVLAFVTAAFVFLRHRSIFRTIRSIPEAEGLSSSGEDS
ncbi:MFS transporter [Propionibacterium australiense]|nr:MFS transporter [Propionibacterium australiense]